MFVKTISGTPFTTGMADQSFNNIPKLQFRGDESWTATARALLGNRANGVMLETALNQTYYKQDQVESPNVKVDLNHKKTTKNIFSVCSIRFSDDETREKYFALADSFFEKEKVSRLVDVEMFLKKVCQTRIYIDEKKHNTFIICVGLNTQKWHLLQAVIPRLMPWYFPKEGEGSLDELELELLRSLTGNDDAVYMTVLQKLADRYDFRTTYIKNLFDEFESKIYNQKIKQMDNTINDLLSAMNGTLREYEGYMKEYRKVQTMRFGLLAQQKECGGCGELTDYILSNKQVDIKDVVGTKIDFVVRSYIDNFDPDIFEILVGNDRGAFYVDYYNEREYDGPDTEDKRTLMKAIFDTGKVKLRVCAAFTIDSAIGSGHGCRDYAFRSEYDTYTPNQHIQHYACLGNNAPHIDRALRDNDYITAIEQCISVTRNMNMAEPNTISLFMRRIYNDLQKCLELPDGSIVDANEAVEWLKKQEEDKQ